MHNQFVTSLYHDACLLLLEARDLVRCEETAGEHATPDVALWVTREETRLTAICVACMAEVMAMSRGGVSSEVDIDEAVCDPIGSSYSLDRYAPRLAQALVRAEALHARLQRLKLAGSEFGNREHDSASTAHYGFDVIVNQGRYRSYSAKNE